MGSRVRRLWLLRSYLELSIGFLVLDTSALLLSTTVFYDFPRSKPEMPIALSKISRAADLKLYIREFSY